MDLVLAVPCDGLVIKSFENLRNDDNDEIGYLMDVFRLRPSLDNK